MPGDFVNAYVLGSVGETAGIIGACATFLYNLKQAVDEIKAGTRRVALVGSAEAPITPPKFAAAFALTENLLELVAAPLFEDIIIASSSFEAL